MMANPEKESGELTKQFPVSIVFVEFWEVWPYLYREISVVLFLHGCQ